MVADRGEALENNETTNIQILANNIAEDATKNLRMPVIRKLDIFYQTYLPDSSPVTFEYELLRPVTYPRLGYMAWTLSIYAVMFGAMFAAGSNMTQEFENDTFEEIELSNQSPIAIHVGKILVGSLAGYVAPPILLLSGWLGFAVWPNGDILVYVGLTFLLAILSASIGLVLGAIFRHSVYLVPLSALSALYFWIMGGGMAPLMIAGAQFEIVDSYSPFSNAYRSLVNMFVDASYTTLGTDLLILCIASVGLLLTAPVIASCLARVDYMQKVAAIRQRRRT